MKRKIRWNSSLFFVVLIKDISVWKTCDFLMICYIYEMKMRAKTFCALGVLCTPKIIMVCEIFISLFVLHFLNSELRDLSYLIWAKIILAYPFCRKITQNYLLLLYIPNPNSKQNKNSCSPTRCVNIVEGLRSKALLRNRA